MNEYNKMKSDIEGAEAAYRGRLASDRAVKQDLDAKLRAGKITKQRYDQIIGTMAEGGRAMGGPVQAGSTYWVGERGPELFIPDGAGVVVPNGGFGGDTINVYYSPQVNALDPRTAADVIAQNAPTVVGIVQQSFNQQGLRGIRR